MSWEVALETACHSQANPDLVRNINAINEAFGEPLVPTADAIAKSLRESPGGDAIEVIWRLGGDAAVRELVRTRAKELGCSG